MHCSFIGRINHDLHEMENNYIQQQAANKRIREQLGQNTWRTKFFDIMAENENMNSDIMWMRSRLDEQESRLDEQNEELQHMDTSKLHMISPNTLKLVFLSLSGKRHHAS